jgi:TonB family protein
MTTMRLKATLRISAVLLAVTAFAQQPGEQKPQKLRVSWGVLEGILERKVEPELPVDANGKPMHGHVVLRINIDKTGSVARAVSLNGNPELANAAINAVQQWKFKPYLLNGEPVELEGEVELNLKSARGAPTISPSRPPDGAYAMQPRTIRVSQGVMDGLLIRRIDPSYPEEAKANHIEGDVVLRATIDKNGDVADLKPVQGDAMLTDAATKAALQWKYRPYLLNGKPVEVETTITLRFHM